MELLGHNFFVFYNCDEDRVNVVYKRKNGIYGLIGPEFPQGISNGGALFFDTFFHFLPLSDRVLSDYSCFCCCQQVMLPIY